MKKIFFILFLFLFIVDFSLFIFSSPVSAHMVGQPPFFKIKGVFTDLYPVPTSSAPEFDLPQDIAKENYLVNQELVMEMDVNQLPVLPEVVEQTSFAWDFGDEGKATGLKATHTYKKPGSYFLSIMAKYQSNEAQLIQSTLINVLPDKNYQLPQPKIIVDGKESKDPLSDILKVNLKQEIQFDSSKSVVSGNIVGYLWDFGDGKTSTEANPKHTYAADSFQVFPVLRVKDDQGFLADAFVQLDGDQDAASDSSQGSSLISWPIIAIGVIILIGVGGIWVVRSKIKK